jgi:hypothetical protein
MILFYMLRRCSSGEKWCGWISHCIFWVSFSFFMNNIAIVFFNSSWLETGDPLSLLLFVIVLGALSKMLSTAVNGFFYQVFLWGPKVLMCLNIFLFANDTLIFL